MTYLRVNFEAPEPTIVELQGPALEAYTAYAEHPSDENYDDLTTKILEQCEHHVLAWTTVGDWDVHCE